MITFILVDRAKTDLEFEEFIRSISYSNSGENKFEIISEKKLPDHIYDVEIPSPDSVISITIPDNCLVLGSSWDKYIMHAVNNGLPQGGLGKNYVPNWENYVQAKMGLLSRDHSGIFPDLRVDPIKINT